MKQITIYDLLPLLKKGWVAMDEDGNWWWTKYKPWCRTTFGEWVSDYMSHTFYHESLYPFNIAPFEGDWKDSLIRVGHKRPSKCASKCSSGGQVEEHIINVEDFAPPHPTGFMSEGQLKRMFENKGGE